MEGPCSTYGEEGEVHTGFWRGNLRERDHSEDPGLDRRITVLSYVLIVLSYILFVCKCVLYYYNRVSTQMQLTNISINININPYPTAFPYGNGTVLHFYQQQESSTTKTVNKVINKGLKAYV